MPLCNILLTICINHTEVEPQNGLPDSKLRVMNCKLCIRSLAPEHTHYPILAPGQYFPGGYASKGGGDNSVPPHSETECVEFWLGSLQFAKDFFLE